MGDPHASANGNVVADNLIILENCNEADIIGEDIDRVIGRYCDGNLELPGKVLRSGEW